MITTATINLTEVKWKVVVMVIIVVVVVVVVVVAVAAAAASQWSRVLGNLIVAQLVNWSRNSLS
jgi:hypothetical protein